MNTKKGFTLVELLVVIAILAILATVSVVGYTSFIDRAEQSNADTEAHQVETALTSALVIPGDIVKVGDYYFTKDGATIEEVAAPVAPATADVDITLPEGGKVTFANGTLTYECSNGKTAEVLTGITPKPAS